jgi:hypothetical protein
VLGKIRQPHVLQRLGRASGPLAARNVCCFQCIRNIGKRRAAQHHRALEHHRLPARRTRNLGGVPFDFPGRRREKPVANAHQHALARAVGAENDRARPGLDLGAHAVEDRAVTRGNRHLAQAQRQ